MSAATDISPVRKLPRPPSRDHIADSHRLVRERIFPSSMSISAILAELRESHSTGTLSLDIASGGVGSIRFREERRIDFDAPEK